MTLSSSAQDVLQDRFGADAIASVQGSEKLDFLAYQNEHGYVVQDLQGMKDVSEFPDALEVQPINSNYPPLTESILDAGIDLFAYEFQVRQDDHQYFKIGNSGKVLVIYSNASVMEQFRSIPESNNE
ncbi:MAG: hypothetical protein EA392_02860 [Cryomorphaceae bacterium]|nr:MAG: hypothetical protein EA392_02860 [Cryomorphaceae bacterium]